MHSLPILDSENYSLQVGEKCKHIKEINIKIICNQITYDAKSYVFKSIKPESKICTMALTNKPDKINLNFCILRQF